MASKDQPRKRAQRKGPTRHIFVTGGVVSSLGIGVASGSLGRLLINMGYTVRIQKFDPYLNVDPGTMNPSQHGEVFVTDDGAETDLDLGHYERFLNQPLDRHSTYTAGQIYQSVLQKERAGKFNGGTVQVIPHITNEIKDAARVFDGEDVDVVITEIGGTVGDIESLPFVEAVRQFMHEHGREYTALCHLAYIPYIKAAGEIKTKPAQHSVQKLREIGLMPDFLFCRTEKHLNREVKDKLALFCNVAQENIIEMADVPLSIYEVPNILLKQNVPELLAKRLSLENTECDMHDWDLMLRHIRNPKDTLTVAMVGKYVSHQDAYKSVNEAIEHAGFANLVKVEIVSIESTDLEKDKKLLKQLRKVDAIVVPGGFGKRGFEGKLQCVKIARELGIPFLGLCLGMQVACVEFARNVVGLKDANSSEMDSHTDHPIIDLMESQKEVVNLGGTMRLGAYPCQLQLKGSKTSKAYGGVDVVHERHRHRFEFN
ncbi:MAG: CTP synthase, partial [Planctomycetes bacterium]|nr:CTP synthase [Planctomycetota bacterium]